MVLISSKKYACETCIKGHRSSTCKHTDRPLFEIKKKGRPVTQCEHCRELRKTRQVHGKCICQGKESTETAVPKKKQKSVLSTGLMRAASSSRRLRFPRLPRHARAHCVPARRARGFGRGGCLRDNRLQP
ncbi:copper fist DNA binding domain-containing protein [Mycena rosella]|uniref:Copper fist DNA binding domain-containing protein n=1 Tax=Mycena rosella TaxID=1033263 RepID=A0AAD7DJD8_MYCRO|nr:copper fist DNA binding domain-containing protein [Mycena rosella]